MTTSKKILAILLSIVMAFSVMTATAFAEDAAVDGEFYTQGDYSIHYTVKAAQGEYRGRILYIHGFLYSGSTWNSIADIMSQNGYDCYLVDLPNFGYSTRETAETELIDREDLMVSFMETIAPLNEWIVAGHSMGGGVAMNIACAHPEIKALMLYCPSEVNTNGNVMMKKMAASPFMGKMMDMIFGTVLKLDFVVKLAVYMTCKDMEYAKSYDASLLADPLMIPGTGSGMLFASANARNTDMAALSEIDTPILLTWGAEDNVIGGTMRSNITAAVEKEGNVVTEIPGSHIVIETAPDVIAENALSFLG